MKQDFLIELMQDETTLSHHGILGQKWGIRRYQNPDGSLTEAGRKRYSQIYGGPIFEKGNDFHSNVEKWGSDAKHNLLAITGISGSGKSTTAHYLKERLPNVDVIYMDHYWFDPTRKELQSKGFNKYLDVHVPEFKNIVNDFKKYDDVVYAQNNINDEEAIKLGRQYWRIMDKVRDAMFDYAESCYGKNRVIAEGVQWIDEILYDTSEQKSQIYRDLPMIMKGTNLYNSSFSAAIRDGESILKGKQFVEYINDRIKANKRWNKQAQDIKELLSK